MRRFDLARPEKEAAKLRSLLEDSHLFMQTATVAVVVLASLLAKNLCGP